MQCARLLVDMGPDPDAAEARVLRFRRVDEDLERRLRRQLQLLEPEPAALPGSPLSPLSPLSAVGAIGAVGAVGAGGERTSVDMDAFLGSAPAGVRTPSPPIAIPGAQQGVWRAPRAQRVLGESAIERANSDDVLYEMEQ